MPRNDKDQTSGKAYRHEKEEQSVDARRPGIETKGDGAEMNRIDME